MLFKDGFPGTADGIVLSPFTDVNSTSVAIELSCGLQNFCSNTTVNTDVGCSGNGGYAEVTCANGWFILQLPARMWTEVVEA